MEIDPKELLKTCGYLRWDAPDKFYHVQLFATLFDEVALERSWGSAVSRLGNSKIDYFQKPEDAIDFAMQIHKKRLHRGYQLATVMADN